VSISGHHPNFQVQRRNNCQTLVKNASKQTEDKRREDKRRAEKRREQNRTQLNSQSAETETETSFMARQTQLEHWGGGGGG